MVTIINFFKSPNGGPPTTNSESSDKVMLINSFQINAHRLTPTTNHESLDMAMFINSFQIKQ